MTTKRDSKLSAVDSKSTKPDELSTAISAARDVLEDESLTAEARAERILQRIADTSFPTPESRIAMAGEVKSFCDAARGLRINDDPRGLMQVAARLGQRAVELARPITENTPHVPRNVNDITYISQRGLASCGWSGLEIEWLLIALMQNNQTLGVWDAWGVMTVEGNYIERQKLRELAAPKNEMREKFLASLPRIPEQNNSEVE